MLSLLAQMRSGYLGGSKIWVRSFGVPRSVVFGLSGQFTVADGPAAGQRICTTPLWSALVFCWS
ncbi:Uncharacterised protein [Mycobacteroides abscessus subsp. massiliense]|nr:Uncharacterised protein [Mycobacteroides abscessus subsp. massiliense]